MQKCSVKKSVLRLAGLPLLVIVGVPMSWADVPIDQKKEVEHLLEFVRSSQCQMDRNGTLHDGVEAVNHIQRKYDYYREDIHTTEEFIDYAATQSTMTRQPYRIHCPGHSPMMSAKWLLEELARYRKEEH